MKCTFPLLPACVLIFAPCCATAAIILNQPVNLAIPDNNGSGRVSAISVADSGQTVISVEVVITTLNGWNGDIYAYLEHNGVISVLLNRPGRTVANPAGAASSGMQLCFADSAVADIHTAISGTFGEIATGTYQPDGRDEDPGLVTDASPRSLDLSGFNGQNAEGDWTLFVADLSSGEVATLGNWGLSLTVVPEPGVALLGGIGLLTLLRRRRNGNPALEFTLQHAPAGKRP
jgi:subtilisin-like proprotein convertase family protein